MRTERQTLVIYLFGVSPIMSTGNHRHIARLHTGEVFVGNHNVIDCADTGASVVGNHNVVEYANPGVTITGNHNRVNAGRGFTMVGNHCVAADVCTDVTTMGNFTRAPAGSSKLSSSFRERQSEGNYRAIVDHFLGGGVRVVNISTSDNVPARVEGHVIHRPSRRNALAPECTYPDAVPDEPSLPDGAPENQQCTICYDRARATVAVPCGHCYACVTCIRTQLPKECAICRKPLEKIIRKFE